VKRADLRTMSVLVLPGWRGSEPGYWQSHWEALYGYRRLEQNDWLWPRRGDWMARLDEAVQESGPRQALVAEGLGCQLVVAWAARSSWTSRVIAALLVAPTDSERLDMPPNLHTWRPVERRRLPFASLVVASPNDPHCEPSRSAGFASAWGSRVANLLAPKPSDNGSGIGAWPEGHALFLGLIATVR